MMLRACVCLLSVGASGGKVVDACAGRVLFVRGAERSGGFLEAGNDASRTEQLADITNEATSGGNHGWFEFAQALRAAGYEVDQVVEPLEGDAPGSGPTTGAPLDFASVPLNTYDVVVLGSNNAAYDAAGVDVLEAYVRRGGAVLFISDANFGGSWADAPTSDQFFLDRFGWTMQQDQGTYRLERGDGDFLVADHPILQGVDSFDGEGVSPIVVPEVDAVAGVSSTIVVRAEPGRQTRNNDAFPGQGSSRPVGPRDGALVVATVDRGRIAGHFDRNTFFNLNGAGTNINRFDNEVYGLNLIGWLAGAGGLECRVDLDGDGDLTAGDVGEYLTLAGDGSGLAEVVPPFDGADGFDLIAFLRVFDADACGVDG